MPKLNGYRPTLRNRWLLVENGALSIQEFVLLEYYADIMDFDHNHPHYGCFQFNPKETAKILNRTSENTIRQWHNSLL